MLSTNRSTSWFFTSRKYSATVSAASPTRSRTPGGSSICPKISAALSMDAGLLHLDPEVGALAGALPHSREHRDAAVLRRDAVDHLQDDDRLAHAGAAEHADLAAAHVGLEQVDDLDAGLEHLAPRLELAERRRLAVNIPVVVDPGELVGGDVERLPEHVEHVAEDAVPDRHLQAVTQVAHLRAAAKAVGGLHADRAHPVVADLLGDLGDDCEWPRPRARSPSRWRS